MVVTPTASRAEANRIAQQEQVPRETIGHRGIAELLLGVVLDSTRGVASPVILTVHMSDTLRDGPFDLDARLSHADSQQQRWLSDLRQAGILVGRAHVVLEAELPSSSYVPWHGAFRPVMYIHDDSIAHCLRVARILDTAIRSRVDAGALVPLWFTIRYFGDASQPARSRKPLTVSAMGEQGLGTLQQYEVKVCEGSEMVATLIAVYQHDHA